MQHSRLAPRGSWVGFLLGGSCDQEGKPSHHAVVVRLAFYPGCVFG